MLQQFTATYLKRGARYVAWVEEVPGVNTQGRTLVEARANLRDALRLVLAENRNVLKRELRRAGRSIREPLRMRLVA